LLFCPTMKPQLFQLWGQIIEEYGETPVTEAPPT
jgi:hypothetical protein